MTQLHVGVVGLHDAAGHLPPQLGAFEHVGLVHRADPAVALAGDVAGHTHDTLDLALPVDQGVEALALAIVQGADATRLTEIDAAGEFTHDHDVQPRHHLGLQSGGIGQLRIEQCRTQVGEQPQPGAQSQQPLLGADGDVQMFPLGAAHSTQQHGVSGLGLLQGLVGQWHAAGIDGGAAHRCLVQLDVEPLALELFQHLHRLGDDLGADAVAGKDEYLLGHLGLVPWVS